MERAQVTADTPMIFRQCRREISNIRSLKKQQQQQQYFTHNAVVSLAG